MAARSRSASLLVATGILLSRIAGLVRQRVFAHYFGQSAAADAFNAAFRIPNFLQNLFGEGVLSASFIPVYSRLLAQGDEKQAGKVAGAIVSLLFLIVSGFVLGGLMLTPWLVQVIAPGFAGERRELTISLVQILFPGAGLLVLSAWCLGVLNSHRKFFLSYAAPVLWNAIMIGAMVLLGRSSTQESLAISLAWASVIGSGAQFLIQLPFVLRLVRHLKLFGGWRESSTGTVLKNFVPVFFGRGVVQISAFIDSMLASFLPLGGVAAISYAQVIYTLPVSLFGMAVSAAELPEMSSALGNAEEVAAKLRERLVRGLRKIALMIVPSTIAFLALGDVLAAALYQTGKFTAEDGRYVWLILAGSSVGLLASTLGRLYSSAWYALGDTRRPFYFSCLRVVISTAIGFFGVKYGPQWLGVEARYGVLGITLGAAIGAWLEYSLLKNSMQKKIGLIDVPGSFFSRLFGAAIFAGLAGVLVHNSLPGEWHPVLRAAIILPLFGGIYFFVATLFRVPEARALLVRGKILRS